MFGTSEDIRMENQKKRDTIQILMMVFQTALVVCFAYMVFIAIKDNFLACLERFPREYREAANLSIARGFLDGKNIYQIPTSGPMPVNVYGFINPLLAAVIAGVTGLNLLNSFYFLYFFETIVFCALVAGETYSLIKKDSNYQKIVLKDGHHFELGNAIIFISLVLLAYTLTFRIGHISTIPDVLGMLIGMLILMAARRCKSIKCVFVISLLVVIEFYVKAYFLFFAAPVFIYFLIKNRKYCMYYVGFCLLTGLVSILIINALFPLYFIENVYFEFVEQFIGAQGNVTAADSNAYRNSYMISQFVKLIVKYNFVLIVGIIAVAYRVTETIKARLHKTDNRYDIDLLVYDICIILAIPVLVVLGKNDGAYMSYHFQLLMPSVLVVSYSLVLKGYNGAICKPGGLTDRLPILKKISVHKFVVLGGILCAITISTYKSYVAFGKVSLLTKEQENNWKTIEKLCIETYDKGNLIFAGNLANSVLFDRRSYYSVYNGLTYVNGLTGATAEDAARISENELYNVIFDDLDEMYVYAADCNDEIRTNFAESRYEVIISDEDAVYEAINKEDYDATLMTLDMGQFDIEVSIFTRK